VIAGAAVVGVDTTLVPVGLAVGRPLPWVTRPLIREMEVPPSELAKLRCSQARAAMAAGAAVWQNGSPATPANMP